MTKQDIFEIEHKIIKDLVEDMDISTCDKNTIWIVAGINLMAAHTADSIERHERFNISKNLELVEITKKWQGDFDAHVKNLNILDDEKARTREYADRILGVVDRYLNKTLEGVEE